MSMGILQKPYKKRADCKSVGAYKMANTAKRLRASGKTALFFYAFGIGIDIMHGFIIIVQI